LRPTSQILITFPTATAQKTSSLQTNLQTCPESSTNLSTISSRPSALAVVAVEDVDLDLEAKLDPLLPHLPAVSQSLLVPQEVPELLPLDLRLLCRPVERARSS